MKYRTHLTLALGLAHALLAPAHAQTDAGLQAISDLAQVNGQALACQELKVAGRIKSMMLAHAPKTARFGSAFEEGTQQSYLAQTRSTAACPDTAKLTAQLDALAPRLQTSLPIQAAEATPGTPSQKP
ncbi:MAG: hypothetical protein V4713_04400 [Pseudomonadota bacterium]